MLAAVLPRSRRRLWVGVPLVAAVAAISLVLWPRTSNHVDEFAARGAAGANARLTLTCPTGCSAGRKLVFDLDGTVGYRYFAAFARRSNGDVIWYFPQPNETSAPVAEALARAIVFGVEQPPGNYRVYGVFSDQPLTREAIRERFDPVQLTAGTHTKVVVRDLVVQ